MNDVISIGLVGLVLIWIWVDKWLYIPTEDDDEQTEQY